MNGGVARYPKDSGESGAEVGVDPQPSGEVQIWWVEGVAPYRGCTLTGVPNSIAGDEELTGGGQHPLQGAAQRTVF